MKSLPSIDEIASCLGGQIAGKSILAPGPNHKPGDRSMVVTLSPTAPDGFLVHTFSPRDSDLDCKNYVRERIGLEAWKPNGPERPRLRVVPPPSQQIDSGPIDEALLMDAISKSTPPGHRLTNHWPYKDKDAANIILAVARYDAVAGGNKTFRPFISLDGNMVSKFPYPRPLYGLDRLAARPDDLVLIVEGEKTADAAGDLIPGYVVVTSPGGACQAERADWSPLVERNVTVWPDHNKAGLAYARDVKRLVPQAKIVSLPKSLPEDWDLADEEPAGLDIGSLLLGAGDDPEVVTPKAVADPFASAIADPFNLVTLCDVSPTPVNWLWPGHLAIGKLTLLGGDPDLGKSMICIDAAARQSRGINWPRGPRAMVGATIFICSEDGIADTVRPRAEAAGADLTMLHVFESTMVRDGKRKTFNLQDDLDMLGAAIDRVGNARLVCIDAITSYMGKIDSHRTTDVRAVLEPIASFAEAHKVAILGVTHPPKAAQGNALRAFAGSFAFVAAPRLTFFVTSEPETAACYCRSRTT